MAVCEGQYSHDQTRTSESLDTLGVDDETLHNNPKTSEDGAVVSAKEDKVQEEDKKIPPVHGSRLVCVLAGLMCAVFCLGLDRSILATAIPKITSEFDSLHDVAWYGSSYLLTTCCFQLLFGKLYGEFNITWVFLAALGIFETGSIICATAVSSLMLILGRAVAGVGCAGILAGAMMIIVRTLPLDKRPIFTGAVGSTSAIAQIIAPTLGGVLTDRATWRWCFWINLPLGAITAAIVFFLVKLPREAGHTKVTGCSSFLSKLDIWGNLFFMPCVICLLLSLQWGGITYSWGNWRVILCLCLFAILFLIWIYIQHKQGDKATLPLRIVRQRSVASGMIYVLGIGGSVFTITYYIPIWFQAVKDTTAEQSGINFLAASASLSLASILSGILTSKIGYYVPQMIGGTIITSIASGLIFRYNIETTTTYWAGTLVVFGFGAGLGLQLPVTAVQTVLQGADISFGTSAVILAQVLSGTIFLAVGQNVFEGRLMGELAAKAPPVDARLVVANGVSGLYQAMVKEYGDELARRVLEAYNGALSSCFMVCIVLSALTSLAAIGMEWKSVKSENK